MLRFEGGVSRKRVDDGELSWLILLEPATPEIIPAITKCFSGDDEASSDERTPRITGRLEIRWIQPGAHQVLHVPERCLVLVRFAVADEFAAGVDSPAVRRPEHLEKRDQTVHRAAGPAASVVPDGPASLLGAIELLQRLFDIGGVFRDVVAAELSIPDLRVAKEPERRQVPLNRNSVQPVVEHAAGALIGE